MAAAQQDCARRVSRPTPRMAGRPPPRCAHAIRRIFSPCVPATTCWRRAPGGLTLTHTGLSQFKANTSPPRTVPNASANAYRLARTQKPTPHESRRTGREHLFKTCGIPWSITRARHHSPRGGQPAGDWQRSCSRLRCWGRSIWKCRTSASSPTRLRGQPASESTCSIR
jgi:hypothetical protein